MVRYQSIVYDSARWAGFTFRPGDIVISTPPKAGTTWTQRICALLIFATPRLEKPLTIVSPWLDMLTRPLGDVLADLEAQRHRRFIKTHTPLDGLPFDERVTYLCVARDPRDIALSWDNHVANTDFAALLGAREAAVGNSDIAETLAQEAPPKPETEQERFWAWVDDPTPPQQIGSSLHCVLNHLSSFWTARNEANVILLHYDDLKSDLEGQMRLLARRLSIDIPEDRWSELVEAATFEQMRRAADEVAPGVTESIWQDNSQFFHRGTSGQWRDLLEAPDFARYDGRVRELAAPDVAAWVHHEVSGHPGR